MRSTEPDETRAEVARRRLAQLAAAFDADLPRDATAAEPRHADVATGPARSDPAVIDPGPVRSRGPVRARVSAGHLRVVGALAIAGLVLLGWMLLSGRPQTSDTVEPVALTSSAPAGAESSGELIVDVIGEVKRPGIVTVPRGSRVYQAIEAAGGLDGKVDTSGVNLARVLDDGEQVVVGPAPESSVPGTTADGKVRLNQATPEQLQTLPGIGPVTAAAIIAWRDENGRFATVDDLLDVKGIGDATLAELRDLVMP